MEQQRHCQLPAAAAATTSLVCKHGVQYRPCTLENHTAWLPSHRPAGTAQSQSQLQTCNKRTKGVTGERKRQK